MIKAVIIDDENNSIEMLEWLLATYCTDVKVLATCNSALKGIEAIQFHKPDLVFLDIEMPVMNGFDMLETIGSIDFEVVFTTAYDQFAVKAFRFAALNYLLKPVDPQDLQSTMARFNEKKSVVSKEQLSLLLENLKPTKPPTERIALSSGDGLIFVKTADIAYCGADSNYTQVVMADGKKITVARTLKELDDTLAGVDFVRVHNSYLVNINHIKKYVKGEGGYIVMPDDSQITISRSKREDFFQLFSKF
jgi:two-component system, LytTR family, response regulator